MSAVHVAVGALLWLVSRTADAAQERVRTAKLVCRAARRSSERRL